MNQLQLDMILIKKSTRTPSKIVAYRGWSAKNWKKYKTIWNVLAPWMLEVRLNFLTKLNMKEILTFQTLDLNQKVVIILEYAEYIVCSNKLKVSQIKLLTRKTKSKLFKVIPLKVRCVCENCKKYEKNI